MTKRRTYAELEAWCQELTERVVALERWAVAHEAEQYQSRVFTVSRGESREAYKRACQRKARTLMLIPGALMDEDLRS